MSQTITSRDLVTRSFRTVGVVGVGETPSAALLQEGAQLLSELIDAWAIQALTILLVNRQVYDLVIATVVTSITRVSTTATVTTTAPHGFSSGETVTIAGATLAAYNGSFIITVTGPTTFTYAVAGSPVTPAVGTITATVANQGGPDHPYTYGPGGVWDTGTAARPPIIQTANLLLTQASTPPVRIPLPVISTQMFAAIPTPSLTNPLPTELYYNDAVPVGLVYLWPIPTQAVNQIELFVPIVTADFPDYDTTLVLAPGYLKTLRLGLCDAIVTCGSFAVPPAIAARIPIAYEDALSFLKASNVEMADLVLDPAYTQDNRGSYVIQTDQGG